MIRGLRVAEVGALVLLSAGTMVAASCGASVEPSPAAPSDNPQLVLGQTVYADNCARCHGSAAQGAVAPALAGKQIDLDVVRNGRRGMPAFGKQLDERQLEAVAAYVAEAL